MRLRATSLLIVLFFYSLIYGEDLGLWEEYKSNFITKDGRVIDYSQNQISHSEGQGYGMQLAVIYNDKATFEKLWYWTKTNLKPRSDNLFAWQWGKRPNGEWNVIDYNNATDGDILIAYALLKADERWHDNNYKDEALKIIRDIRKNLAINWQDHTFLLPSYYGFVKENGFVLNPSYLILPAFRYFAQEDDKPFWEKIYKDSLYLISQTCFGKLCLPSDWIFLDNTRISVFTAKNSIFGSEAIRILLYLSFEKSPQFPKGVEKILDIYKRMGYLPLWIDLEKDSFSLYPSPAGYYAIYALVAKKLGDDALSKKLFKEAGEKLGSEKDGYYSFSLYLLAISKDIL